MTNVSDNLSTQRILIADDDKEIVRVLNVYLAKEGYTIFTAYDGNTAMHTLMRERPQLAILDIMMPEKDGMEVTRLIRGNPKLLQTYILMLTAKVEDIDKVIGLELGADDYVTKPFNPREIVARVRSAFRRLELRDEVDEKVYFYRDLIVDMARRRVTLVGRVIDLTPTEFNLLAILIQRPSYTRTRNELLQSGLGYEYESMERTLDSHIYHLRKKIEPDPNNPIYIETVYGVGYRLGEA
ncbi:MAG: response regulator transcription factor [Chloroflexi bacterium]|nr:response regulator transcription factor [Chloroflexota bacterium]MCC6891835.1 response regulator transcription factor [Anaerolineae bacterium]